MIQQLLGRVSWIKIQHVVGRVYWIRPLPLVGIKLYSRKAVIAGNVLLGVAEVVLIVAIVVGVKI